MVAIHNDYRLDGENFTFWLMTKSFPDGSTRAVRGEGRSDVEALDLIRREVPWITRQALSLQSP